MILFIEYISQSPIIPLVFSALIAAIILMQCFTKRKFLKVRLLFVFLLVFISALALVFQKELLKNDNQIIKNIYYIGLLVIEFICFVVLFTTVDFSLSNDKFQKVLTKSLDETKFFVMISKKEKIKEISTLLAKNLDLEPSKAVGKNFFDIIENKYRIIGLNGEEAYKKDVKRYYDGYYKRVQEGTTNTVEINIQDDNAKESAFYFVENLIFSNGKYRGRILIGDIKNEETLVGMEKELNKSTKELTLIKNRFVTILNKTSDGIFFNNLSTGSIWFNDILVRRLCLNGNSINNNEFYSMIHQDDMALYQDVLNNLKSNDYSVTYRYNTGSYYVYVKEDGHKVVVDGTVELCGVMNVIDNYRYEKTDTILDSLGTEPEMLARFKGLCCEDKVFQIVRFKINDIPEINDKFGRGIGNMMLSEYINFFKQRYVIENYMFRVSGLEFVAFITNYNKMEMLKTDLRNEEKILHVKAEYAGEKVSTDIYMGISYSNDTPNPKDTLVNAKRALTICTNPQFTSFYAYFRDVKC